MSEEQVLVILGEDAEGKPHASRFSDGDAEAVAKAAAAMSFRAVRVGEAEALKAAAALPAGKLLSSGKAYCPVVKRDIYEQLLKLGGAEAEVKAAEVQGPAEAESYQPVSEVGPNIPDPWAAIGIGSIVLASVDEERTL